VLDGNNDYFTIPTSGYTGLQTYTIEFWFMRNSNTAATNDFVFENGNSLSAPSFEAGATQPFNYYVGNSNAISSGPITLGTWYHAALQYDKTNQVQRLYINGVLKGTNSVDVSDALQANLFFGSRQGGSFFLNGSIDEIRIWNTVLTQTEIRDWMCRKLTPLHPQWNSLLSYYRMDEATGNSVFDLKGVNDATLFNGAALQTSGASLGDASAYDYSANPFVSLAHPQGEHVDITTEAGSPAGIQLYRVDERPNHTNGAPGIGTNDRYFGVHLIEGTNPTYTITYWYDGNPFVNASNENLLALYKRKDNSDFPWQDANASLDPVSDHLGANGQSTEYILGLTSGVLPVTYESFIARKSGNAVRLEWKTAVELNNSGFEILKSSDGINYSMIGWVPASTSVTQHSYSFTDGRPGKGKNYYRLNQKDADGHGKLSEIRLVNFALAIHVTIFPNPASDLLYVALGNDDIRQIDIVNAAGMKVWSKQNGFGNFITVPLKNMASGVYILRIINQKGDSITERFIRQ
jgi:hypothetical protein